MAESGSEMDRVRRFLDPAVPSRIEGAVPLFGELAVSRGFLSPGQVSDALEEQKRLREKGEPILIGQVLLRKGFLSLSQFLEVLQAQNRSVLACRGCGKVYNLSGHPAEVGLLCLQCGEELTVPRDTKAVADAPGVPTPYQTPAYQPGKMYVGRYRLVREIARGGMGVVYEAEDENLKRRVALKMLKEGEGGMMVVKRLHREAALAARLQHPSIITIHEVGAVRDAGGGLVHYICMDYIEGETLGEGVKSGRWGKSEAVRIVEEVARAVHYAHGQGVIHRDLKPGNILVDGRGRPVVTDFGLARMESGESKLTRTGAVVGTPMYMAPEQVEGKGREVDARTDVYALGVTLYEVLTGRGPFAATTAIEMYKKILDEEPPTPRSVHPGIDEDLETVILKAMAKEKSRRYSDALELAEDLKRHQAGDAITARPPSMFYYLRRTFRKRKSALLAAAVSLLAAALILFFFLPGLRRKEEQLIVLMREQTDRALKTALDFRRAGDLARMRERAKEVEEICGQVIREYPHLAESHYRLGRMYRALLRTEEALEEQHKALACDPGYPPARYERGLLKLMRYNERMDELLENEYRARGVRVYGFPLSSPRGEIRKRELERPEETRLRLEAVEDLRGLESHVAKGLLLWLEGDDDGARSHFILSHRETPEVEEAYLWLSRMARDAGKHEEAVRWYTEGLERDRGFLPFFEGRAMTHWAEGWKHYWSGIDPMSRYQEALRDLDAALELEPGHPRLHAIRGSVRGAVMFYRLSRGLDAEEMHRLALEDFDESIRRDPKRERSWEGRGVVHGNWGNHLMQRGEDPTECIHRAIEDFNRAVELQPEWREKLLMHRSEAQINLSLYYREKGLDASELYEGALRDLDEAIRLSPTLADYRMIRGTLFVNWAVTSVQRGEDPVELYLRAFQDFDEAIRINREIPNLWMSRATARSNLGSYLRSKGEDPSEQYAQALEDFDRALQLNPKDEGIWVRRGGFLMNWGNFLQEKREDPMEKFEKSLESYDAALRINARSVEGWAGRAGANGNLLIYYINDRRPAEECASCYVKALQDYEKVFQLNPHHSEAYAKRGYFHFAMRKWALALEDYRKAVQLNPTLESSLQTKIRRCERELEEP